MTKYHSRKTEVDGIMFDSLKEASRYKELKMMQESGLISDLELQKRFEILPKSMGNRAVFYVADFVYTQGGQTIVEDCKGFKTDVYKLKKKMFEYRYQTKILES